MLGHCILAVVTVPHVWLKLQVQHRALWGGLQSWRPRERSVDFAVVQLNCMLLRQDRHTVATEVGPQRHPMTELCAYVQFCCNLIFKFTVAKWYHVMLWCHRLHHHHLHRLFVHWDSYNEQWIIWQYNMTERHIKVLWQLPKLCVKLVSIGATLQPKVLVNRFHRLIRDLRLGGWQLWPSELQLEAFWDKGPRARWSYWGGAAHQAPSPPAVECVKHCKLSQWGPGRTSGTGWFFMQYLAGDGHCWRQFSLFQLLVYLWNIT